MVYDTEIRLDMSDDILDHLQRWLVSVTNVHRFPSYKEAPTLSNSNYLTFSIPFSPTKFKIGFTVYHAQDVLRVKNSAIYQAVQIALEKIA